MIGPRLGGDEPDTATGRPAASPSSPTSPTSPSSPGRPAGGLPQVDVADLPPQAGEVLAAIDAGGPFDHPGKDGSTFGNFEGLLPDAPRGFYREYTVPTPGSSGRGARRIVTGDDPPVVFYWTDDHYDSFTEVRR